MLALGGVTSVTLITLTFGVLGNASAAHLVCHTRSQCRENVLCEAIRGELAALEPGPEIFQPVGFEPLPKVRMDDTCRSY